MSIAKNQAASAAPYYIVSLGKLMAGGERGFFSRDNGWTSKQYATRFATEEKRVVELSTVGVADAAWIAHGQVNPTVRMCRVKRAIIADGFDVAQAPDARWYWADEQDREDVTAGEFDTESQAWFDLSQAREYVLEEAGLSAEGLFDMTPAAAADETDTPGM